MSTILIAGAGGAPSEGVIRSLMQGKGNERIIGMGAEPADLVLSLASKKFYVPYADSPDYAPRLFEIIAREQPDLVHFQNDLEIYHASLLRDELLDRGAKLFMPEHSVIETCVHKFRSYEAFRDAGIPVPRGMMIRSKDDLQAAFAELGDKAGRIWLRSTSIGGGGKGAIPTNNLDLAAGWIDHYRGWGQFMAAEMLTQATVTWLSIWHEGELIVAQSRKRQGWIHGNRSISGVTGVTKVGVTVDDAAATETAIAAIRSVANRPHGIFGVDMAYNQEDIPMPTEINISRFFTTVLFFTAAGLNMPEIFKDIALYGKFPKLPKKINPLRAGLRWFRGMDTAPRLMTAAQAEGEVIFD